MYHLRVTAHNNAGSTVAFYNFTTLTAEGGNIPLYAHLTQISKGHIFIHFPFLSVGFLTHMG
jgi:hypothetical protein